jgi:hypothetical protein
MKVPLSSFEEGDGFKKACIADFGCKIVRKEVCTLTI